ncbi:NAD(P)-dependent alcohol dehydrogenase [Demequina silvatica]|uniref:NAD(P)-dependent alcohol dehydrogenase n=1 Tax=Demequina silvatica TaxID=1638988 RepID=UPI0009E1B387|nr:NAD(P)-dependent alcohol dehydrogenase [Demequina silvatica]
MTALATATMPAAIARRYGDADAVEIADLPVPAPGPREVLLRVDAAAFNPADVFLTRGVPRMLRLTAGLRRPRRPVRGSDVAGTVVSVGSAVTGIARGDRVFGEARGSAARYAVSRADRIAPLPAAVLAPDAAATVMAGLAALHGLRAGRFAAGHRVLINGASGGIGHLAAQMAVAQGGRVTAVCSTRNAGWVADLGVDRVVDYTRESVLDLDQAFDLVFDNVGNHRMRDMLRLVADGGVLLPNSGEAGPDGGAMRRVLLARWVDLRTRGRTIASYYSAPSRADLGLLAGMLADGTLRPHLDRVVPLDRAGEALARVASRHAAGKVVVTP